MNRLVIGQGNRIEMTGVRHHILEMGLTSEPSRKKRENGRGTGPSHLEHSFDEQVRLDQSFASIRRASQTIITQFRL
jgi:hypothetical protein